ncbi:hypothetical protein BH23THE1_BH23THE1_09900 [soil metagenome]
MVGINLEWWYLDKSNEFEIKNESKISLQRLLYCFKKSVPLYGVSLDFSDQKFQFLN